MFRAMSGGPVLVHRVAPSHEGSRVLQDCKISCMCCGVGSAEIRALRKRAGLSQPAFAEALGVSAFSVSGWENGRKPSRMALAKLQAFAESLEPESQPISPVLAKERAWRRA